VTAEAMMPSEPTKKPISEEKVRATMHQTTAMQVAASRLCDPTDLWARAQSGVNAMSKSGSIPNKPPTIRYSMSPPPTKEETTAPAATPDTRCVARFV
jgi:hypothetical protein